MRLRSSIPAISQVQAAAYRIPTERPEADGTLDWDHTTLVVVHISGGGQTGLGMTYADRAAAAVVMEHLAPVMEEVDAFDVNGAWWRMQRRVRNLGRSGIAMTAISAVDIALWDLKARLLGVPLTSLLGRVHEATPVYISAGFIGAPEGHLAQHFGGLVSEGMRRFKMKVGRNLEEDSRRVALARQVIGPTAELYVDANGAYAAKEALHAAQVFADAGHVSWLEEPVTSDDLTGLRLVREQVSRSIDIVAGEYGYTETDFLQLLQAGAVDVLQADVTRCGGLTGFLNVAALTAAFHIPLSTHTAPSISAIAACAVQRLRPVEFFFDHARIEENLFEGAPTLRQELGGSLRPDPGALGHGLMFKCEDAEAYRVA